MFLQVLILFCIISSGYSIPGIIVEVSTSEELIEALKYVNPGDTILLSGGVFEGSFVGSRNGTVQNPITIKGQAEAILMNPDNYGFHLMAHHWILSSFTVTQAKIGIVLDYASNNIVEHITVHNLTQEGIHLRFGSSDNIIRHNRIYNLGTARFGYGEGIYIGQSWKNWVDGKIDECHRNAILYNWIGPDVRGESIDIKEGTCCGLIEGNFFDGRGMTGIHYDDAWVDMKGENYTVQYNHGSWSLKDGFWISNEFPAIMNRTSACNNIFRNNFCDLQLGEDITGFCIAHNGTDVLQCGNLIYSDNKAAIGELLTDGEITNAC